jgi:hypothetical protein
MKGTNKGTSKMQKPSETPYFIGFCFSKFVSRLGFAIYQTSMS